MWGRLAAVGFAASAAVLASCGFTANGVAPGDGPPQAGSDAPGGGSGTNGSGSNSSGSGGGGSGSNGSNGSNHGSNGSNGGGVLPCPTGYLLTDAGHPGSFYKQVTASTSWSAAETDCENDQIATVTGPAHLIVLDDQNEAAFAWSTNNSNQWVGHTDIANEASWIPVTNQPNAFTGNATGNNNSRNCLEVTQSSGQTTAESCTQTRPYLCECDGNAADPANYTP